MKPPQRGDRGDHGGHRGELGRPALPHPAAEPRHALAYLIGGQPLLGRDVGELLTFAFTRHPLERALVLGIARDLLAGPARQVARRVPGRRIDAVAGQLQLLRARAFAMKIGDLVACDAAQPLAQGGVVVGWRAGERVAQYRLHHVVDIVLGHAPPHDVLNHLAQLRRGKTRKARSAFHAGIVGPSHQNVTRGKGKTCPDEVGYAQVPVMRQTRDAQLERVLRLIEHAPDAIAVHRDGRFVFVNAALVKALGYDSPDDLLGRSILDIVHPEDRELAVERMKAIYATGAPNPVQEHRFIRRDGTVTVAEVAGVALEWGGGSAVVTFARDVTERKRMQTQLMLADRMAALGTLCAGVAHEINNPLAYVMCNIDIIVRELPLIARELDRRPELDPLAARLEDLAKLAVMAREGTQSIRRIVGDLRTLAHVDEGRAPVDVRWVLNAAVNLTRHEVSTRARLELDYHDVPLVNANAPRLEQVFVNLLINAAQAVPPGSPEENWVRIRTFTGDGAVVEVTDSGIGLAPDALDRVFDPFFTTKPAGEGMGLGLAICHGIVTDLGGEITVQSAPGRGATFRVRLPPLELPATLAS